MMGGAIGYLTTKLGGGGYNGKDSGIQAYKQEKSGYTFCMARTSLFLCLHYKILLLGEQTLQFNMQLKNQIRKNYTNNIPRAMFVHWNNYLTNPMI